ncbi:MAG TPA: hypothetical protein VKA30_06370 [Actinomycetota bacterium]|nr:hypothetical protein [Actinomycetota bacterium]
MEAAQTPLPVTRPRGFIRRSLPLAVGLALLGGAGVALAARLPEANRYSDRSAQVDQLTAQLKALRTQLSGLQGRIPAIETNVAKVEQEQERLSKTTAKQEKTIKALRAQVKELKG